MPDRDGLLTFAEFRQAVSKPEHRVRAALFALSLQPIRSFQDERRTWYRPEWVTLVASWLAEHSDRAARDDDGVTRR